MPLLNRDLESYAMDEALLELEQQDDLEWVAQFIQRPLEERLQVLSEQAALRWSQKLHYAQHRFAREGWEGACHGYALEVLGYARNRAPMLRLAEQYSLAVLRARDVTVDELFESEAGNWKLNGLRPANHPRWRLAQYLDVVRQRPDWPQRLADYLQSFPEVDAEVSTSVFRKMVGMPQLRDHLSEQVFAGAIGETRLNTMIVDALLPLGTAAGWLDGQVYWSHWSLGDSPDGLRRFLKHAGVTSRQNPQSNGWNQGALALFLERGG
jgi:hypothetical protein